MSIAIKAENIGKAYQLGEFSTGTISRDIERWWALLRGKEDPFLKLGETNDRSTKGTSDIVWSLKDINFEINQGDAVGIIGRNGAGKSTLLKVLSRVTSPSIGNIKVKGRIASLLEVGTGFHPELTGRENIYLNGAILGMRKHEISRKFEEIVDFSGVERYIDTPVKRYSSGMYVRLAFAVAAHLESEILIVDEVLAVGDAEFQKKCLGKMGDVSKTEGRTVLFVSHNMGAITDFCRKCIVLKNGTLDFSGNILDGVNHYLSQSSSFTQSAYSNKELSDNFSVSQIKFVNNDEIVSSVPHNTDINLVVTFSNYFKKPNGTTFTAIFKDNLNKPVFATHHLLKDSIEMEGERDSVMIIPKFTLLPGDYTIDIIVHIPNIELIFDLKDKMEITIDDSGHLHSAFPTYDFGRVVIPVKWKE